MDETEIDRLPELDDVNREIMEDYLDYLDGQALKPSTIGGKTWRIYSLLLFTKFKDLRGTTKDDIKAFHRHRKKTCSLHTVANDIIDLRVFFKWLLPDQAEEMFRDIKVKRPKPEMADGEVTRAEDVRRLIAACDTQRDRALIATLWETGARLTEISDLDVQHIEFDRYGAKALVNGKTGQRPIRLIDATPDLQQWINMHPARDKPHAPLFCNLRKAGGMERLKNRSIQSLLKTIAKRAGVAKRIHPHGFRHGRCTDCAVVYTEPQMRQKFGWSSDSAMPAIYVHLSARDVEKTDLMRAGLLDEEEDYQSPTAPIRCPRCTTFNAPDAKFCKGCSMLLDMKMADEIDAMQADVAAVPEALQRLVDERIKAMMGEGKGS